MDNSKRYIQGLIRRFIKALLQLYPSRFRHEFYPEIQDVILSRLRRAEQIGQWPSTVVHEIAGLVPSIIRERWHDLRLRKETMMGIANEKPRWFFYFGWVALNVIAVIMAWYITWAIISQITEIVGDTIQVGGQTRIVEDYLTLFVLLPTNGLLTGILQYILLRRYLPNMIGWIAATFLGWLIPFVIGFIFSSLLVTGSGTPQIMFGLLILGVSVALPQWWMLRKRVQHAGWWVLVLGLGWGMVGSLDFLNVTSLFPVLLGIAFIPAITTSIACWLLLDRFPNRELSIRTSS